MGCPGYLYPTEKHGLDTIQLEPTIECPVCAIKACMTTPDCNPTCGHRDYPADRLINSIIKYTPTSPDSVWNKGEETAICGVSSTWCGRSERRRFKSLKLCSECYGNHIGTAFLADWPLNSAASLSSGSVDR